ncbi:uncharacterized protein [Nicotiana sylvestris]|uniref:uncharacterized protein n=1 Tax=Nicotiana sylvestris TaxID=4096 RepID=UPI00388C6AAC
MMKDHIIGEDYELWDIVTDGPLATTMKNKEGVDMPKTRVDCTTEDLKKWEKNAKAKKWLVCGLGPDEYSRIQSCTTAKEIWDTLQVAHEGTPQVKRSRGTLLYSQYENFTMKEGETIQEMYTRFTALTNELKSIGRIILEKYKVEKIMTRVLQTMKKDTPKKERSLALRIAEGSDLEDNEMAMITRDFKKYLIRGKGSSRDEDSEDEVEEEQAVMALGESDDEQEEDLGKVKHEIDRTCKWNKASDALSWLQEHHRRNKRGLGYGTQALKWDPKSKYLTLTENKICTHCGKIDHYKNECNAKEKASQKNKVFVQEKNKLPGWVQVKGRSQIWYIDSGCSKHMTGNKDQFLSLSDLKGGNVSFGNGKKDEAFDMFIAFVRKTQKQLGNQLVSIRSDHGNEFENSKLAELCDENGIDHNFSAPRTLQQNGVVEMKNRTLEDMARTMLLSSKLPHSFWAEAVNIACYIIHRCMTRPLVEKTPYELLKGRKPNIFHLRAFGCKCYVHNNGKDSLEESVHVVFDETNILSERQEHEDEAIGLVKELTESPAQDKVASKEGTCDGTGPSNQGNLTEGTNQGEIESNPLEEPVHEPVPQQQNMGETSSRN